MKHTSQEVNFIKDSRREGMKTRIREFRMAKGLTQQQLAELVHVSSRTIISIEKERYSPSLMLAYHIAVLFGTTVEDLCCLKENSEEEEIRKGTRKTR